MRTRHQLIIFILFVQFLEQCRETGYFFVIGYRLRNLRLVVVFIRRLQQFRYGMMETSCTN